MATNTEKYGFRKVGLDAGADIEAIEANWDLLDAELKRIEEDELAKKANESHTHSSGDITSLGADKISAGTFADTGVKAKSGTDYGTARVRNIKAGTDDLTPGTSALTSGDIYFVYE